MVSFKWYGCFSFYRLRRQCWRCQFPSLDSSGFIFEICSRKKYCSSGIIVLKAQLAVVLAQILKVSKEHRLLSITKIWRGAPHCACEFGLVWLTWALHYSMCLDCCYTFLCVWISTFSVSPFFVSVLVLMPFCLQWSMRLVRRFNHCIEVLLF